MRTRPRRPHTLLVTLAAAACLLAGCGDDPEPAAGETPAATPSTSPTASATPSEEPAQEVSVTAYYVGDTPGGAALYAEPHAQVTPDHVVSLLLVGPADPDYRTLLPAGSIVPGVSFDGIGAGGSFQVELTDASWSERPAGMSGRQARLAVQQLVWTLNSVQGGATADPTLRTGAKVSFVLDGEEVSYLGVPSGAQAAPELDVLAAVNITAPADGTTVDDTFTATGLASSFEATVPWEVQDASGAVVLQYSATAEGWVERLYPWTAEIDVSELPAGNYTFVARTDDPSGGEGGGPTEDTKRITVP
ncbi:Gmad2 immunoglobulin-like domain-containing protein [Nocardioides sp. LHD-245]|uniref:Gmad2 immunoglobulin-like domain-containing protein n=1 Tax=Nocardioides sp. LHD-245 TaxID=3051387 RepID=UPI0027E00ED1|nr:Gmad2 immunoglobulin-like domain-containing protein [Nocardioides sp. LHD-245]